MRFIALICLLLFAFLPRAWSTDFGSGIRIPSSLVSLERGFEPDTSDRGLGSMQLPAGATEEERSLLAKWLDIPADIVGNVDLFRFIRDWYRTPYRFGGTQRTGIDCSAFTQRLYKEIYNLSLGRMVSLQRRQVLPVERSKLVQGDLVFFHTTRPGLSHVGVYLGDDRFIHASSSKGVVIDNLNSGYYAKAFRLGGRVLDVSAYIRAILFH